MTLRAQLALLSEIIADEADRNSRFRHRLEEAFGPSQIDLPVMTGKAASKHKPVGTEVVAEGVRKGGRRTPAVLDPLALARQSQEALTRELAALDIEQLKDVVAQFGMDPGKLVMKWKDNARIIERIVDLSMARSTKGDAFRADKPVTAMALGEGKISKDLRHPADVYTITIEKLPIPKAPIGQGHTDRELTISGRPDSYGTEPEALSRARALIGKGYTISIIDPAGSTWSHTEIAAKLS